MKKFIAYYLFTFALLLCVAPVQAEDTIIVLRGDTFVIKSRQVAAGCFTSKTLITNDIWCGDQKLAIKRTLCVPECAVTITSIGFTTREDKELFFVKSTDVLSENITYFTEIGGKYVRLDL